MSKIGSWTATCLVLLCGCNPTNEASDNTGTNSEVQAEPLATVLVNYFTMNGCSPNWTYTPPSPGLRFDYAVTSAEGRPDDTIIRSDVIAEAHGLMIDYETTVQMGDTVLENSPQSSLAALLPIESDSRRWSYRGLNEARVFDMAPGETLSFTGSETARIEDHERTTEGPLTLTFVGCATGTDHIPVADGEPLRIYHLRRFWQTSSGVNHGDYEIALSERWGWRVMDRDGSAAGVVVRAGDG